MYYPNYTQIKNTFIQTIQYMYNISHLLWYKRIIVIKIVVKSSYFEQRFSLTSLIDYGYIFTAADVGGIFGYLFQRPNFK